MGVFQVKKNDELPKVRITSDLGKKMQEALDRLNGNSIIEINMSSFRRLAYKYVSELILLGDFRFNLDVGKRNTKKPQDYLNEEI